MILLSGVSTFNNWWMMEQNFGSVALLCCTGFTTCSLWGTWTTGNDVPSPYSFAWVHPTCCEALLTWASLRKEGQATGTITSDGWSLSQRAPAEPDLTWEDMRGWDRNEHRQQAGEEKIKTRLARVAMEDWGDSASLSWNSHARSPALYPWAQVDHPNNMENHK